MSNLKALRQRINSVKATRKITSAMKMVSAAKLRRAQDQAERGRPYAQRLEDILCSLAVSAKESGLHAPLLIGTGNDAIHLVVIVTADRGLCGSFNASVYRQARTFLEGLRADGKNFQIICIGRKGRDLLGIRYKRNIISTFQDIGKGSLGYDKAQMIADAVIEMANNQTFDVCTIFYNRFKNVISQEVTKQQLIPLPLPVNTNATKAETAQALPLYEPSEQEIVKTLLPKNLTVQIYKALLESNASEHAARMTAMDNATRNAGDMINKLSLQYNRTRQAMITKELIEIISGAEAV